MERPTNLNELFIHQLKDMWSAQTQFVDALDALGGKLEGSELATELGTHKTDLKKHVQELERLAKALDFDVRGNKCEAAAGLVRETRSFLDHNADSDVRDAGLIANLQRMLHYNIAGFGTAASYARELDLDDVFITLNDMLETSRAYDSHLTQIAKQTMNRRAVA